MDIDIRRIVVSTDRSYHEGGPRRAQPARRAWAAAIITNPFAGKYVEDLVPFMDQLEPLAYDLTLEAIAALGVTAADIQTYGKAAYAGMNGEMEHAAIWHAPGGAGLRRGVEGGDAAVPGSMKVGAPGQTLDMALGNMDVINVRDDYDSLAVNLGDSPKPNEIAYIVAIGTAGRPHARLGTLITSEEARANSKRGPK